MPDNNSNTLAGVRWAVIDDATPANNCPPPTPGYRESGSSLFYVTDRGDCWLVLDERRRVQLTPAELPERATVVDEDDIENVELTTVAEAADALAEIVEPGVYEFDSTYYIYTRSRVAWMLYGSDRTPVRLPFLPANARPVRQIPGEIATIQVALAVQEAG